MTSEYGIIDIATLEAATCKDYSSYVDQSANRAYTDTHIEAWITEAEQFVVAYCGKSYDSTAPSAVKLAVKYLARINAENQLKKDGYMDGEPQEPILTTALAAMLDLVLTNQASIGRLSKASSIGDW